jgi:EmrB/QacA subfamily drug resistance transporter
VVLVVSAAAFLASLDLFIVNLALPAIRTAFPGGDLAAASWVLNGYTVVFAAFLAPAGRLADRYGRKLVFLTGLAVFTVGSAGCALAPSLPLLVALRAVQAVGAALIMPTSLALLLAAVPAARRAVAVSLWSAVGGAAAAVGPVLGGLLVPLSWRWVFLVNLPVGVLALVLGARRLAESRDTGGRVPDLLGAAGLVAGVGAVAWVLVTGPDAHWRGPGVLTGVVLAVAGLLGVLLRSRRHPAPVLDLPSLRVPAMWLSCLAMLLFMAGFGSMLFANVLFLTSVWHDPVIVAGLSLAPGPVMVVLVSLTVGGRLARRFGPGPVAALGAALFATGTVLWVLLVGPDSSYALSLLPGQLCTGAGVGLVIPSLSGVVGAVLPAARWGSGASMINTARQVGAVLGTAVLVVLFGPEPGMPQFRTGWAFLAATGAAAAVTAVALATRHPAAPAQAERLPSSSA